MARVPYPRVAGLSPESAEQLNRNFEALPEDSTILFSTSLPLVVGTFATRLYVPFAGTIVSVRSNVQVAPTSTATFDVLKNGTSIFTVAAKPTVLTGAFVGAGFSVPDTRAVLPSDYLQVGVVATGAATGLVLCINIRRAP